MSPPKEEAGPEGPATSPNNTTAGHHSHGSVHHNHPAGHRRAAAGWRRKAWLSCGCFDPCRCDYRNTPSEKRIDGYKFAIEHLAEHGLCAAALSPELRVLWRRGGSDRRVAETISRRWTA